MDYAAEWPQGWEYIEAPGRHAKRYPAEDARGYQFMGLQMDRRPRMPEVLPTMNDRVIRAIPVDGTVQDGGPSWQRSPQARFWLEKEPETILQRLAKWLKKSAA